MTTAQALAYIRSIAFSGEWLKSLNISPTLFVSTLDPLSYNVQVWVNDQMSSPVRVSFSEKTPDSLKLDLSEAVLLCCQQIFTRLLYTSFIPPTS